MESRRKFIRSVSLTAMGTIALAQIGSESFGQTFEFFDPIDVKNPLLAYPNLLFYVHQMTPIIAY